MLDPKLKTQYHFSRPVPCSSIRSESMQKPVMAETGVSVFDEKSLCREAGQMEETAAREATLFFGLMCIPTISWIFFTSHR